jgi:hypothetical protein
MYYNSGTWSQVGADIEGEAHGDNAGEETQSISISANGKIIAVGAPGNDDNGNRSGHVRIYALNEGVTPPVWVQRGQDIDGEAGGNASGYSVSISSDGSVVAIGAPQNSNGSNMLSGHVRVYSWNETATAWEKRGEDIDGNANNQQSGNSVSISGDGTVVAIGRPGDSPTGDVRVYYWNSSASPPQWQQRGSDINGGANNHSFGINVSISTDGNIVAIGDYGYNNYRGQVKVYMWNESTLQWIQRGQNIDGEAEEDQCGLSVSISGDGSIVAIGAPYNSEMNSHSGNVRIYAWNGTTSAWVQRGQGINGELSDDNSGWSVSISEDGGVVAIGTPNDNGDGMGYVRVYGMEYRGSSAAKI